MEIQGEMQLLRCLKNPGRALRALKVLDGAIEVSNHIEACTLQDFNSPLTYSDEIFFQNS